MKRKYKNVQTQSQKYNQVDCKNEKSPYNQFLGISIPWSSKFILLLLDFHNLYSLSKNGEMHKFLKREIATSPNSNISYSFRGEKFGIDDLLSGYLHTKYANLVSIGDAVRRFSNVLSIASYGSMNSEEAIGMVRIYQYLKSRGIGFSQSDRQALRGLFLNAEQTVISLYGEGVNFNSADGLEHIIIGDDFDRVMVDGKNTLGNDLVGNQVKNDALLGTDNNDLMFGERGNDTLLGNNGDDVIYGGEGGDTLYGEIGDDTLIGGGGSDTLYGGNNNDTLYGDNKDGSGSPIPMMLNNDTLYGSNGNDTLYGGTGSDRLEGGINNDTLIGGVDKYTDDNTYDYLIGGDGDDTYYAGDSDAIYDADGIGTIYFKGVKISGEKKGVKDTNGYVYEDNEYYYILRTLQDRTLLTISSKANGDYVTVDNFDTTNPHLGISLLPYEILATCQEISWHVAQNNQNYKSHPKVA